MRQNVDLQQIPQYNLTSGELNLKNYNLNLPEYPDKEKITQMHFENMKNLDGLTNNLTGNKPKVNSETSYNLKEKLENIILSNTDLMHPYQSKTIQVNRLEKDELISNNLNEANLLENINSLNKNISKNVIEEVKEELEQSSNLKIKDSLISKPNIKNITLNPKSKINLKSINDAELERIKKIMRSNIPKNKNNEKDEISSDSDD